MPPTDDENITLEYLKKFRPRTAPALNLRHAGLSAGKAGALALLAAAITAVVAVIILRPTPTAVVRPATVATLPAKRPAITVMELNAVMRKEDASEAALARTAREILPITNEPNTALNALSRE